MNAATPPAARRAPVLHWPSVRGRARADAGPLLLVAAVVVVVTLLAGAVPPLLRATADEAVRDAIRAAGNQADVTVTKPWEYDDSPEGGRYRDPHADQAVDALRGGATEAIGRQLAAALRPPVAVVTSPTLNFTTGTEPWTFRLAYLAAGRDGSLPRVTWVAGKAPGPSAEPNAERPYNGPPWPMQVGLSEAAAAELGVRPGDWLPLVDVNRIPKRIQVSGTFRPVDRRDPAWGLVPWVLDPVPGADGFATTRFGGLLSRESLPDAHLAFELEEMPRTVRFSPNPDVIGRDSARAITATIVSLKLSSGSSSGIDPSAKWGTQLDSVLRDVQVQVAAAEAQSSVLIVALLAVAVLVLLLAGELLVRRRAGALAAARQRGAGLPDLAAELVLESTAVALLAGMTGLALARLVAPGVSLGWAAPVVVAATLAAPAFGLVVAARATRDQRAPANRSARRWAERTVHLRRFTLELAILVAAAAALVALHQRGVLPSGEDDPSTLPATAPTLGVLVGGLVLLRLVPVVTAVGLRWALRSRHPLAMFAAARAAATAARPLPLLALVASTGLAVFAVTVGASATQGVEDGAWRTVGADARVDVADDAVASTPDLARRIAGAPGVTQVATAEVRDHTRMSADRLVVAPTLVAVDAAAFRRLLAANPLPDAPALAQLTGPGPVRALIRSDQGLFRAGQRLDLLRDRKPAIPLTVVGTAPPVDDVGEVVIVDASALAAAGAPPVPDTIWVAGPGAARAVDHLGVPATALVRDDVARGRADAPLTRGLLVLALICSVTLLALALLGLALGAAGGAVDRWQTLTRLRTLGMTPRETRRVAAGELLPPVLLAALAGPALGVLLARLTLGPLELRRLTGQAVDPSIVLPWWALALVMVLLLIGVAVVVPVESAARRRRRLGEVLRAGS